MLIPNRRIHEEKSKVSPKRQGYSKENNEIEYFEQIENVFRTSNVFLVLQFKQKPINESQAV